PVFPRHRPRSTGVPALVLLGALPSAAGGDRLRHRASQRPSLGRRGPRREVAQAGRAGAVGPGAGAMAVVDVLAQPAAELDIAGGGGVARGETVVPRHRAVGACGPELV